MLNPSFRTSETAVEDWFSDQLKAILAGVEKRLKRLVAFDRSHLEYWQATLYARNGHVDYHLDSGYWEGHWAGDRILTFLIDLTTPTKTTTIG